MKFWKTKPTPSIQRHPFHPQTVIRDWGNGYAFRVADAQCGTVTFGSTGGGKSSGPNKHLAFGCLKAGFGFLVLTAKKEDCRTWQDWVAECDRSQDLIIVNAEGDWRYNFMEEEASRPGGGGGFTINIVALLDEIGGTISGGGKSDGGGDNKVWEDALHTLNTFAVGLPLLAGLKVTLPLLRQITSSAAQTLEQVNDPVWQKSSLCYQILQEADQATKDGDPEARADFEECRTYWTKDFPSYSDKTKSSILMGFTVLIQPLVTRPLRKLFSSDTNIRPEDTFDGKIIVIDIPVQEYKLVGRIANLVWKYCFQCAVLRRAQPADRESFLRPVALWADECQHFVTTSDAEYQATCRSAGGCTFYLTQNRESLRRVLRNNDAVDSLLGNLVCKIFCNNTGETNEYAAKLLGEHWVKVNTTNVGQSNNDGGTPILQPQQNPNGGFNSGVSRSEQRRYWVDPATFTTLKRGGPQNDFQVEAIIYNGGQLFQNGKNLQPYIKLTFNQK
jgi:hypothetical protein